MINKLGKIVIMAGTLLALVLIFFPVPVMTIKVAMAALAQKIYATV